MSTITKRQTFWRDHVLAAAAFDGTSVQYATLHNDNDEANEPESFAPTKRTKRSLRHRWSAAH